MDISLMISEINKARSSATPWAMQGPGNQQGISRESGESEARGGRPLEGAKRELKLGEMVSPPLLSLSLPAVWCQARLPVLLQLLQMCCCPVQFMASVYLVLRILPCECMIIIMKAYCA